MLRIASYRYRKLITISVFFCLCATSYAQETNLFDEYMGELSPAQQQLIQTVESRQTTKRTRVAVIGKSTFSQNQISANLFDDKIMNFNAQNIGRTGVSYKTWTGTSQENLGSAAVLINGTRVSAHITSLEGNFEIFPLDNKGTHLILEHDMSQFGACGNDENAPRSMDYNESEIQARKEHPQRSSESGECRIRLLVGYTPDAQINTLSTYNRTMIEHIELAILQINQGYANSLVDQRVELAYLYKTADEETGNSSIDINDLRDTSDGKWDEIHELRNNYNADLVALITDGGYPDLCGKAYGFNYELEADMFQITEYNCAVANFTLAHECAHLQGCRHDIDGNVTPFGYGHGYSQGGAYRTIMAICCDDERVNYWSNPYVYYPGIGAMGTPNFNYNALALNSSYPIVAQHRLTPSTIDSDDVLGDDHLVNSNTPGLVVATDTTMNGSSLILESQVKVKLAAGFRSYNGSHGKYRITTGCVESAPLVSVSPNTVQQRDNPPQYVPLQTRNVTSKNRDTSAPAKDKRDR